MTHEPDGAVTPPAHGEDPEAVEPTGSEAEPEAGAKDAAGSESVGAADLPPEEEPTTTGTLFIMILFLMALAGMWGIMYLTLLNR